MAGAPVKDISADKQLVDLAGAHSVQLTDHHGRVAHSFREYRSGIGPDRTHLSERERRQVQGQTGNLSSSKPRHR